MPSRTIYYPIITSIITTTINSSSSVLQSKSNSRPLFVVYLCIYFLIRKAFLLIIVQKYRFHFKCLRMHLILNFASILLNKSFKAENYLPIRNTKLSLSWGNSRYNKWLRNPQNHKTRKKTRI